MPEIATLEKYETPVLMNNTPSDGWRVMNPKENKRAPKHTTRFICAKAGSPKRGDSHGDGTPIWDRHRKQWRFREVKGAAYEGRPECV